MKLHNGVIINQGHDWMHQSTRCLKIWQNVWTFGRRMVSLKKGYPFCYGAKLEVTLGGILIFLSAPLPNHYLWQQFTLIRIKKKSQISNIPFDFRVIPIVGVNVNPKHSLKSTSGFQKTHRMKLRSSCITVANHISSIFPNCLFLLPALISRCWYYIQIKSL